MDVEKLNWKNLIKDHPKCNCHICLKIGDNYETFKFKSFGMDGENWELRKYPRIIPPDKIPSNAEYIILEQIK